MATIVVVDDDYSTTTLIRMLLEMEGYNVVAATTVAAALAECDSEVAALIIDCYLSDDETGIEFVRDVRQGRTHLSADVPAILVSGDQRMEQEAAAAGANLFLLKPYSPNELTTQIRRMVSAAGSQPTDTLDDATKREKE